MSHPDSIQPINPNSSEAQRARRAQEAMRSEVIEQVETVTGLQAFADEGAFSIGFFRKAETLETKRLKKNENEKEIEKKEDAEEKIEKIEKIDKAAEKYQRKNPELQTRSLASLRSQLKQGDSQEEVLRKTRNSYPDLSLADDALDFLYETTEGDLKEQIGRAKKELNANYGREIIAGKNIAAQARAFSKEGLGTPTGLRNVYREVTGNPRDAHTLFNELTSQFSYDKMKTLIDFLLNSLGGDLKSKGPSIDRGELHRLLSETRKLQSILGIFRFFKSRMNLILAAFQRQGMILPLKITFEALAKQLMQMIQERYPSPDKIRQMAAQLGISEELLGQLIIYTQMRDALRQIAPKLFKSDQHRQELLLAFIETIEEIDELIDEEEEEEEDEEQEKEGEDGSV